MYVCNTHLYFVDTHKSTQTIFLICCCAHTSSIAIIKLSHLIYFTLVVLIIIPSCQQNIHFHQTPSQAKLWRRRERRERESERASSIISSHLTTKTKFIRYTISSTFLYICCMWTRRCDQSQFCLSWHHSHWLSLSWISHWSERNAFCRKQGGGYTLH